jgi:hypothetical protein
MMMVFSAFIEGSVLFVLAFSLVIEQLLQMAASKLLLLSPPSQRSMWFCAAGVVGLGASWLMGKRVGVCVRGVLHSLQIN